MTYRLSLILGLVIALPSAMLPAARGSNVEVGDIFGAFGPTHRESKNKACRQC